MRIRATRLTFPRFTRCLGRARWRQAHTAETGTCEVPGGPLAWRAVQARHRAAC